MRTMIIIILTIIIIGLIGGVGLFLSGLTKIYDITEEKMLSICEENTDCWSPKPEIKGYKSFEKRTVVIECCENNILEYDILRDIASEYEGE